MFNTDQFKVICAESTSQDKPMIRQAKDTDSEALTRLSFASKAHWDYPQEFFDVWSAELTITPEYINQHDVFVLELEDAIVAYYSLIELENDIELFDIKIHKGFWLDHMFIAPKAIGYGLGRQLFRHLLKRCTQRGITTLGILSDPNAKGFYEKMGCKYEGEYPSTIEGRTTPYLTMKI